MGKKYADSFQSWVTMLLLTARSVQSGEEAAKEVGARFMELDVSKEESVTTFVQELQNGADELDVLINNAGIFIDGGTDVRNIDLGIVRQTVETNVYGPWKLTQELLPFLEKSPDGRIINVSSGMGAIDGLSGDHSAYRISKTALNALTLMTHASVGANIKVNAMCPGWVRTDMGGSGASRPVEKGAETAVWLATADDIPAGKFLRDKAVIAW